MKKRFTEEQIVRILQEAESGVSGRDLCRKHKISEQTLYRRGGRPPNSSKIGRTPARYQPSETGDP